MVKEPISGFYCTHNDKEFFFLARRKIQESGGKNQKQGKGKSGNNKKGKPDNDQDQHPEKEKGDHTKVPDKDDQGKKAMGEGTTLEYFKKYKGAKMTVVFHAVLAPHFKFEASEGDRIFMRFGGFMFGSYLKNVVEVYPAER